MFDWVKAYKEQCNAARRRGIAFQLSFEQWLKIWKRSGKSNQRGRKRNQYVMARFGDQGPYAIDNVQIITCAQNGREAHLGKKTGPRPLAVRKKIADALRGKKHTAERRRNESLAHIGIRPDPEMLKRRNRAIKASWARRKKANVII